MPAATFAATLWPAPASGKSASSLIASSARAAALMILGALALWVSAKIKVGFPVPMTMQTFVVLTLGAAYGARLGVASVFLYLVEGAVGLPVFADTPERGIGLAYMMGPTGGYLVGFLAGAFIVGWLAERGWDRSVVKLFAAMAIGHVAIIALGFGWLALTVGVGMAWAVGVAPFFAATIYKTLLGALILPAGWALIKPREQR
ncbi:biotin transporter BioY [Terrarubrum flagellatum]|uniref:biotin transporter BioY n=1 Tax=Terrirubrum flagellatum TaxID=2895980 RepID=UPI0031453CB8